MSYPGISSAELLFVNRFETDRPVFESGGRVGHILGYQLDGEYLHTFSGGQAVFRENTLMFLRQDVPYTVHTVRPGRSISFFFRTPVLPEGEILWRDAADMPELRPLFLRAMQAWTEGGRENRYRILSDLYRILSLWQAREERQYITTAEEERWKRALVYIRQRANRPLSLREVTGVLGVKERRARDLFRLRQGQSFTAYLSTVRMQMAAELLSSGMYTVEETAARCGFTDATYFSKSFKRQMGVPPGQYSRRQWEQK